MALLAEHGVDVPYILTGERHPAHQSPQLAAAIAAAIAAATADPAAFVPLPLFAAELAAGHGAANGPANGPEQVEAHLAFRRDWLRRIGLSPANAVLARARGDSMAPALADGDLVLIDRARTALPATARQPGDTRPAPVFALLDDSEARVKRIEATAPGGPVILISDNPAFPPEVRDPAALAVIGRVLWWGHTLRPA